MQIPQFMPQGAINVIFVLLIIKDINKFQVNLKNNKISSLKYFKD
jgi:hypothetical protein